MKRAALLAATLTCAALAACTPGPRFATPAPPAAPGYTPAPPDLTAPGVAPQTIAPTAAIPADWWRAFTSPKLDALVTEALANSPTLTQAEATLRQANEIYRQQHAALFPSLALTPSYQRGQESIELQPPVSNNAVQYTVVTAGAQITFNPDVFGGLRLAARGARAQAQAAQGQLAAARLTLIGNVVTQAITLAGLDAQLAEQRRIVAAQTATVALGRLQVREGQIAPSDLAALQAQLAQSQTAVPPLNRNRAAARDQLAVLLGRTPDRPPTDVPGLNELTLPATLPVVVPARLVETRPDIRIAEANLRAAYAQLGIATAARLPVFNLVADGGTASQSFTRLLRSDNIFWTLIAGVTAPLLDAGTLLHGERAARAGLEASRAQYRATVLTGLGNVADSLEALSTDARALAAAQAARAAADRSLAAARLQRAKGQTSALPLLVAQASEATAAATEVQARAARLSDSAALFTAMGGGAVPSSQPTRP